MNKTVDLTSVTCWCGVPVAIPTSLYKTARENPTTNVYCPLGHMFGYGTSEADRLKRQLEQEQETSAALRQRVQREREYREAEERRHRATKGQLTKTRKRVANGVCPCCSRSFVDVARHMKTKHPDLGADG